MHVPVQLGARAEGRVDAWKEVPRDGGRNVFVGDVVGGECEGYLVKVQRERLEVQEVGDRLDIFGEAFGAREGERVVHRGGSGRRGDGGAKVRVWGVVMWRSGALSGARGYKERSRLRETQSRLGKRR